MTMRISISGAALLLSLACCFYAEPSVGTEQAYPTRPIRFIVPFPAGGGTDFVARTVGQKLSETMGQSIITDNRGGASGMIGVEAAARSPADGYTILIAGVGELTINPSLYSKISYDVRKDLQAITLLGKNPMLLVVNPKIIPVTNLRGFIDYAKANPGKIDYGSFGIGSISHVIAEDFTRQANIKLTHVPYKGAAPALQDVVGGQIGAMFVDYGAAKGFLTEGTLIALAVSTKERHPALPSVPTLAESGIKDFDEFSWIGSMVPAGTPAEIVAKLNQELVKAVASPTVQKNFAEAGFIPATNTPEQYTEFVHQELARWRGIVSSIPGLKLD
jgi:tripartite-type tricarboxylate transporter receptor subunit TctC